MTAKEVFEKLISKAASHCMRLGSTLRRRQPHGKPGELVEQLSPEERELLKNLTVKDFPSKEIPRGRLEYFTEAHEYPQGQVSVFCHSDSKKSEEE